MVRVGITTSLEQNEQRLSYAYLEAVEAAEGFPVIVPMFQNKTHLLHLAHSLDALVVTGGPAVVDGLIGSLPVDISKTDALRVKSDKMILQAFLKSRRPVLGICYGMQLLNAMHGGTIFADVEQQKKDALVHSSVRGATSHSVTILPGTRLSEVLKVGSTTVNTRHIQAVAEVGDGLVVAAEAPDGVVEAIENKDGRLIGVQFHPERMGDAMLPLFKHLVKYGH